MKQQASFHNMRIALWIKQRCAPLSTTIFSGGGKTTRYDILNEYETTNSTKRKHNLVLTKI